VCFDAACGNNSSPVMKCQHFLVYYSTVQGSAIRDGQCQAAAGCACAGEDYNARDAYWLLLQHRVHPCMSLPFFSHFNSHAHLPPLRPLQYNADDFANVALIGQQLHHAELPEVVQQRVGLRQLDWTVLRKRREQSRVAAEAFASLRATTYDEVSAQLAAQYAELGLVDEGAGGSRAKAELPAVPHGRAGAGAAAVPLPAAATAGSAAADGAAMVLEERTHRGGFITAAMLVIDLLAAYQLVPPLYNRVGNGVLVNELKRVFELGALGQRCSGSKQVVFAGHPGVGKTTMLLYIAAVAAVCFPHVLTVYWTWERAATDAAPAVPSTAGGSDGRVGLTAGIAGAAAGTSASAVLPVLHVTEPIAAERQRSCAPPATVAQVLAAAIAEPQTLLDTDAFQAIVRSSRTHPLLGATLTSAKRPVVFLGDELHDVYETASAFPGATAALVSQLREAGKDGRVFVALAGSSTNMFEYTMAPPPNLRGIGIVDLNHGTYDVIDVFPPRDGVALGAYLRQRFKLDIQPPEVARILHWTGGIGRQVADMVLHGSPPSTASQLGRLLTAVDSTPGLRALFVRFAGLYPAAALEASMERDEPLGLVAVKRSEARAIVQDAGVDAPWPFIHAFAARGLLFVTSDNMVQPMRPRDVAYITRELLASGSDRSAVLCI
jgi:hypothetical protein